MEKGYGLALGGGAALGITHLGVIKYLQENHIEITHLSGTSAGSIAATALALGIELDDMIRYVRDLNWRKFTTLRFPRRGLISSEILMKRLEDLLGDRTFEDCQIPVAVVATDLRINQRVIITEGRVLPAVAASCAIPGIFTPVRHEKRLLCDGGLLENVPIRTIEQLGAENIIAVDLTSRVIAEKEPTNLFDIIIRAINILLLQSHQTTGLDHIVISPELSEFTPLDIHRVDELIEVGYTAANRILEPYLQKEINSDISEGSPSVSIGESINY